jgi:hypothetical protein
LPFFHFLSFLVVWIACSTVERRGVFHEANTVPIRFSCRKTSGNGAFKRSIFDMAVKILPP